VGGGQHCLFDADLASEHQQKIETEKALTEAVQRDEFVLAFQPQMSLITGEVAGAEALLRWNHPRDGLRLPATFIPVAERTGLIAEIGEWVIAEVATTLAGWQRGGFDGRLAFNISPRQVERPDFFVRLRQSFADAGVPLSIIELEFTESAAMEVSASVLDEIAALRADGARIAIDDFGTGYSGLAYLKRLPIDTVKIDQSFVRDLTVDPDDAAIVTAIVAMARSLGVEVVAEGVETEEQLAHLAALGCQRAQGYLLARPMNAAAVQKLLARRAKVVAG
jgi:EAL domain-containing protein (putative c-di-GMP-specific phosphodiesterase class I)